MKETPEKCILTMSMTQPHIKFHLDICEHVLNSASEISGPYKCLILADQILKKHSDTGKRGLG